MWVSVNLTFLLYKSSAVYVVCGLYTPAPIRNIHLLSLSQQPLKLLEIQYNYNTHVSNKCMMNICMLYGS